MNISEALRHSLRIVLPVAALGAGVGVAWFLTATREAPNTATSISALPTVEVRELIPGDVPVEVTAQGTVRPTTESELVAEVAGRVMQVAQELAAGSFFDTDDVLVSIDPRDFELAVVQARAELERTRLALALEEAEADSARREWQAMQQSDPPAPLVLREPQIREAKARVAAAEARLASAERDVERCVVRAPYRGRVLDKFVDLGQFVTRGTRLARVHATASAEVRLPIDDRELAFLQLDLDRSDGERTALNQPAVTLSAQFAGRRVSWQGRVVRTEAQLDPTSRMVRLVARVERPTSSTESTTPPLMVGMFVDATIRGVTLQNVYTLPRAALRDDDSVLIVDAQSRVYSRRIDLIRREREHVLARAEFAAGERLCVTPLEVVIEGMPVHVAGDAAPTDSAQSEQSPSEGSSVERSLR